MENNIEVAARIRPPIRNNHLAEDVCLYADPYTKEIVLANQMSFYIDYALPVEISQSQLFDTIISSRIDYMLQGHDVSFIAYGHTNSGKTYTILGPGLHCALSETTYGVLPRSGREIFNKLLAFRQQFGLQFVVFVSFIEICNEEAKDLLASHDDTQFANGNIGFTTNAKGLTVLYGVQEIECHTVSELFNCLRSGMSNRKTVRTNLNLIKSLSHCVVIIKVQQKWFSNLGRLETITSQVMFVDLAGDEQMFLMSPVVSNQLHQTAIGNIGSGVISAIIASFSGQWLPSSPFTQSLLFPLLKDSFVGSIKTLLICCLSPSSSDYSETLNSLRLIDHIHTLNKYSFVKDNGDAAKFNVNNNNNNINDYRIAENLDTRRNDNHLKRMDLNGCSKDSIGLEFAASQWLKLISNAEGLFNKLVDNDMPEEAREQIEQWLCLKQECEECFGVETKSVDNSGPINNGGRSLEIIEEVTETDTKSKSGRSSDGSDSDVNTPDASNLDQESSASEDESGQEDEMNGDNRIVDDIASRNRGEFNSVVNREKFLDEPDTVCNNSHGEEFGERLNKLMERFKLQTDKMVDSIINVSTPERDAQEKEREKEAKTLLLPKPNRCNGMRRKSILPGDNQIQLNDLLVADKHGVSQESMPDPCENEQPNEIKTKNTSLFDTDVHETEENARNTDAVLNNNTNGYDPPVDSLGEKTEFQMLAANSSTINKQSQLGLATLDLEAAWKRIQELQSMIKIKEQFIEEMIRNSGARISAKAKFQRKHTKLEEEYFKARTQLAKAEKALNYEEGNADLEHDVEKYKGLADQYEKRLQDIETIKQIAGDSAKKVLELQNSLHNSKRKMQKLRKQLKKEEEHKYCLERELVEDQKRIKFLEERYKMQSDKLKSGVTTDSESKRLEWIAEEEGRLINLQVSWHKLQQQLQQKENLLEKRESFLKEKISQERVMSKSLLHVSARISHLEQVLREKSTDLEQEGDLDSKEALRHEIRNLRRTRDCLVQQRRNLDAKFNKDKVLTIVEERKFLECDEAIEAIDATIEYKNELICGRKGLIADIENGGFEKTEEMLLMRLMKLSTMEMRILLYKYFRKVIDLRETGRKMETQIAELDRQAETQSWKIQALSNALQQAHLESERRLIAVQKEHEEKLHLMFRHFADETSGHSSGADDTEKCRRQNKALKQRILELEAVLYKSKNSQHSRSGGASGVTGASNSNCQQLQPIQLQPSANTQLNIPHHNLKQLQSGGASAFSSRTTKVTREKNKLIIQQHKTSKKTTK